MKFSIRLNNDLPVADYLRLAQEAEKLSKTGYGKYLQRVLREKPVA